MAVLPGVSVETPEPQTHPRFEVLCCWRYRSGAINVPAPGPCCLDRLVTLGRRLLPNARGSVDRRSQGVERSVPDQRDAYAWLVRGHEVHVHFSRDADPCGRFVIPASGGRSCLRVGRSVDGHSLSGDVMVVLASRRKGERVMAGS
jgi:hypothetical protein